MNKVDKIINESIKDSIKKGIKKYKDTFSYNEDQDADNPAAIDFKQASKDAIDWLRGKKKKGVQEGKQIIRLSESDLHRVIKESVKQVLKEYNDYDGNYQELIKDAMHYLYDLEGKVPYCYRAEIHSMVNSMQAMYQEIQRKHEFVNQNN